MLQFHVQSIHYVCRDYFVFPCIIFVFPCIIELQLSQFLKPNQTLNLKFRLTFRRSGDEDVMISGTGKRRRLVLPIIMSNWCLCGQ
ncbi:hypothetical protein Hanom_Chr05g00390521 [Helianthus anomalus]